MLVESVKPITYDNLSLSKPASSILVAMHSRRVPPMPTTESSSLDLDSSLQSAMFDDHVLFEWERWGDDTKIHLCEVRIAYEDFLLGQSTWLTLPAESNKILPV